MALIVISLGAVGGLSLSALRNLAGATSDLSAASEAQHLQQDADMQHDALRAHVLDAVLASRNSQNLDQIRSELRVDSDRMRQNLESLAELADSPAVANSINYTRPLADSYIKQAEQLVEDLPRDPGRATARLVDFDLAFRALKTAMDTQTELITQRIDDAHSRARATGKAAETRILYLVAALSALATILVALLIRSVRNTLRRVRDVATRLADGDLSTRNNLESSDEIGELADAIDRMAGNLSGMISRLRSDAERDAFGSQLIEALEMVDTEREVHSAVGRAMQVIAADRPMELLLADSSRAHLEHAAENPTAGAAGCSVESPFSCIAVRRGNPVSFSDSEALNSCPRLRGRACGPVSAVCVPVSFMGRALGVLHTTGPQHSLPTAEQITQLTTLGIQTGARIGTVRAFEKTQLQAATDSLTGLPNRRALENTLRNLASQNKDYALVMCDLDHFKVLNDRFGHAAGDSALRVFADSVRSVIRGDDFPARWGGEEFAIVMPGTTAEIAVEVLNRLRMHLAGAVKSSGVTPFTASFGVADTSMGRRFDDLVRIADEALYRSKDLGRDQATIGDGGFSEAPVRHETEQKATINVASLFAEG